MHARSILHRILSAHLPDIHAKRLASLLAAVEAVVSGSRLTLSDVGRGLSGPVAVKHTSNASTGCWATAHCTLKRPSCTRCLSELAWRGYPCC